MAIINFLPVFDSWCGEDGDRWYPCFMITKSRGTPATINGYVQTGKTCKHDDHKNPPSKVEWTRLNAAVSDAYEARDPDHLYSAIKQLLKLVMCPWHTRELESGRSTDEVEEWVSKLTRMVLRRKPDDAVPKFDESKFGPGRRTKRKRKLSSDSEDEDEAQRKTMRSDGKRVSSAEDHTDADLNLSIVSTTNSDNNPSSSSTSSLRDDHHYTAGLLSQDTTSNSHPAASSDSFLDGLDPALFETANNSSSSFSSLGDPALDFSEPTHPSVVSSSSSSSHDPALSSGPVNSENQPYFFNDALDASSSSSSNPDPDASSSSILNSLPVCSFCGRDAFQHHKPLCAAFQAHKTYIPLADYCSSGRCCSGVARSFCNQDSCWNLWCEDDTHLRWNEGMHASTCTKETTENGWHCMDAAELEEMVMGHDDDWQLL
ncbi:hypothetical protein AC579_2067 [Pseudocercospora musae]|uniref:Uncharacterized protein n=1 Tax=Pseudocercospora musae TaxID=113226 RepID=A0A139GT06_9PEZI|nr:hypothetical protein AC579_2067 [Pseudocercospora musae]